MSPMLNLRPAVTSLMMQDRINIRRRSEVVNDYGENTTADQIFTNQPAVVYPEGENKLDRRPEAQSTTKVIGVVSVFAFRPSSPGSQADVVTWRGDDYLVMSVQDYSQFGAGFTYAMAEALPLQQTAPETKEVYT